MKKLSCLLATCAALPASAGTFGPFHSIYVFGDSLSDSGNLAIIAPQAVPNPPYPDGQFTNGDTWATQLGLTPSLTGGTNFAFGGARANDNGDFIPDLQAQIGSATSTIDAFSGNALAVIWAGGNDFLDFSKITAPTDSDLSNLISGIATTIGQGVQSLASAGVSEVAVFGLPDFAALPQFAGDPADAAGASFVSGLLNGALVGTTSALDGALADTDVSFFDLDAVLQSVLPDLPEATQQASCFDGIAICTNPEDFLFFDNIHPVEGVHTILAGEFSDQVLQPVPLPAGATLLLTGLVGFGVWGRRRKSLS
ncbi:VPLPA-CTERM sorting domain-containing protein [Rhodobacteraceae bacterium]|nr:VPLPA-CTERM sorting domain-containing protein [Paracoccaceae bacterium]